MKPIAAQARREALARRHEIAAKRAEDLPGQSRRAAALRKLEADFPAPPLPPAIPEGSRAADYWRQWAAGKPTASEEHLADVAVAALLAGGELHGRSAGAIEYAGEVRPRRAGPGEVAEAIHAMERSAPPRFLG